MPEIIDLSQGDLSQGDESQRIADLFTKLAGEVNAFRDAHYDQFTPTERISLVSTIQQLYDFHDQFAGVALQHTIDALKGDLTELADVTRQATESLNHLNSIKRAVEIASAAADIAQAVATGGYGQLPDAVRSFVKAVRGSDDKSDSD